MTLKIYSAEWCSQCDNAKDTLMQRGIAYEVIDVDEVPEAMDMLMKEGIRGLPAFDMDGKLSVGPKGLQEVLNER